MTFTVRGQAVAQGRPRFFRRGSFVGTFDPDKSKTWKESVKWQAIEHGAQIVEGALALSIDFYLLRPKSLPKKVTHHIKRPDMDNLIKAIKDALNGIAWRDDSQVCQLTSQKLYTVDDPRVEIEIQPAAEETQSLFNEPHKPKTDEEIQRRILLDRAF